MSTHSSILAWEIPWTEESGGLQSMELLSDTTEHTDICTVYMLYTEKLGGGVKMAEE